jgi:glycolate oxidase iron-sulfur subunit
VAKVKDISEFLVKTMDKDLQFAGRQGKVTYHDPCHLVWAQGLTEQPRHLLHSVPELDLVEMKNSNTCCGGAGSYNLTHYETSMGILDKKAASIGATGAGTVATGCPGCRLQIGLGMKRKGMPIKVVHPVDLLKPVR